MGITSGVELGEQPIGIMLAAFEKTELLRNSSIRSNCISETYTAIYLWANNCERFENIYNNFLYNYQAYGVYANGISPVVGSGTLPGCNSFVSNNSINNAIDVYAECGGSMCGNFGVLATANIEVEKAKKYHSTATCAKQVSDVADENYYDVSQLFSPLQMCNRIDEFNAEMLYLHNGKAKLNENWQNIFTNNEYGINEAQTLLRNMYSYNKNEFEGLYLQLQNMQSNNANNHAWLQYTYSTCKQNYTDALQTLQNIQVSNTEEQDLLTLETVLTKQALAGKAPLYLNANDMQILKTVELNNTEVANYSRDIQQVAKGNTDYRFKAMPTAVYEHGAKVQRQNENTLLLYPNPALQSITLDLSVSGNEILYADVLDAQGRIVHTEQVTIKTGKFTMDVENLTSGLYQVQLRGKNQTTLHAKFMKK
jgi:hypothetical protein